MAKTIMPHISIHWSEYGIDDFALLLFAVKHATCFFNWVTTKARGLTQDKMLTKTHSYHCDLLLIYIWGCPNFKLDPDLKNGQKISK